MRQLGIYLMIFGIGSIILSFLDLNFRLLLWIDAWGLTTGWIIRIGLTAVGLVLFSLAKDKKVVESQS